MIVHHRAVSLVSSQWHKRFPRHQLLQQIRLISGGISLDRAVCSSSCTYKTKGRRARFKGLTVRSIVPPVNGLETEDNSLNEGQVAESVSARGGQAGPGPGSEQTAAVESSSSDSDPRKEPLIQRIIQALGWPFLAFAQLLGTLLKWLIPSTKFRR
jgi:hypothetical protein